jgi:hypothetical protein
MTALGAGAHGLDAPVSCALAAACLIAFFAVLWFVCGSKSYGSAREPPAGQRVPTRRHFWYIFLGTDDRVSTSKVQFALWALALVYAQLVVAFHVAVYPAGSVDPGYLVVLGFPAGAAVGAKAVTMRQLAGGGITKPPAPYEKKSPVRALREIASNDQGDLDLGDVMYFIVTLLALAFFFIAFFRDPVKLPVLPDALVALTAASATAYLGKKAVSPAPSPDPVKITAVNPRRGPAGTTVKIFGSGLSGAAPRNDVPPEVTFGGLAAIVQQSRMGTVVYVGLPTDLRPGTVDIRVITPDGRIAIMQSAFELTP